MTYEVKGSTPGLITDRPQLARFNTFPNAQYTIPPSGTISQCSRVPTRSADCPAPLTAVSTAATVNATGDEEKQCAPIVSYDDQGNSYPEGGRDAWLVVLGSFLGMLASFGTMNTIGVYTSYLSEHQLKDYDASTVSWIFSMYVFLTFFCGIQIGPIFDAKGPKMLVLAGSVCLCSSFFILGECTKYWHFFLTFGVLAGLGTSLIFVPAVSAVGHFFYLKRGNATGISAAGGSLGGVIFPLALQKLIPSVGFAWATRIVGFIDVFCCIAACLLIRSRLAPKPGQSVMPDFRIFKDYSYLLVTIGVFFLEWGMFVPIAFLTTFATSTGAISPAFSYQLLAIFNASSCTGRYVPGLLADRFGRFNSMIAALALGAAMTLTLWMPASLISPSSASEMSAIKALTIAYAVVFGFASGSNISLTPVCVGQLCKTENYGRYYSTCYTIVSFGSLTGLPIAGSLLQATGGPYWGMIVWTAVCYSCSCACFVASRGLNVGWKIPVKY